MPVHFEPTEMKSRRDRVSERLSGLGLDGLLMFKQESMYYLTGYDTFGFSMFQCLIIDGSGNTVLLTRLPDLR
ncbi:MAG: aminopeptidase P family N-terminal domain-containing protein, partial [Pseudomonadota bacterium]|nr:aminopeptidase P family N-terminal domain-containing protein [Pseudomonadota bacterium]